MDDVSLPDSTLLPGQTRPVPPGYRRATRVSPAVRAKADFYLKQKQFPIGTQIPDFVDAKYYLFVIEWHKHAPTDNVSDGLKQWHRGISVFEAIGGYVPVPGIRFQPA